MNITPYVHKVAYYETDRMGIVHHSNYIRIMEEARLDFLSQIGFGYDEMEKQGIISPRHRRGGTVQENHHLPRRNFGLGHRDRGQPCHPQARL